LTERSERSADRPGEPPRLEPGQEPIDILALSNDIYFVLLNIGNAEKPTHEMKVAVDTCSGSNLVRRDALPPSSELHSVRDTLKISDAQGGKLKVEGIVFLEVQLRDHRIQVPFIVVDNLTDCSHSAWFALH
jgi:hypothetical protein